MFRLFPTPTRYSEPPSNYHGIRGEVPRGFPVGGREVDTEQAVEFAEGDSCLIRERIDKIWQTRLNMILDVPFYQDRSGKLW